MQSIFFPSRYVTLFTTMMAALLLIAGMARADLVLTVTATPGAMEHGLYCCDYATLTLNATVSNTSSILASGVVLSTEVPVHWVSNSDTLDSAQWAGGTCSRQGSYAEPGDTLSWNLGDLNPGQSRSVVLAIPANQYYLPPNGILADNIFHARATNSSDVVANARMQVLDDPSAGPDSVVATSSGTVFPLTGGGAGGTTTGNLVLTVTATPGAMEHGLYCCDYATLTLNATVSNMNSILALGVVLSAQVPVHWVSNSDTLDSAQWAGGTCSRQGSYAEPGDTLSWNLGDLNPGQSRSVVLAIPANQYYLPPNGTAADNVFYARALNCSDVVANARVQVLDNPIAGPDNIVATASGAVFPPSVDNCPNDPLKTSPGVCGCNVADTDSDADGTPDCNDGCDNDPNKTAPGNCGCGVPETSNCGNNANNGGSTNTPNLGGASAAPGPCAFGVAESALLSLTGLTVMSLLRSRKRP